MIRMSETGHCNRARIERRFDRERFEASEHRLTGSQRMYYSSNHGFTIFVPWISYYPSVDDGQGPQLTRPQAPIPNTDIQGSIF